MSKADGVAKVSSFSDTDTQITATLPTSSTRVVSAFPQPQPALAPGRIRSSRACTHCSQRKARCDGNQPCATCVRGNHDCIFTTPKKRGPPKGAPARGGIKKRALADCFVTATSPPLLSSPSHVTTTFATPHYRVKHRSDSCSYKPVVVGPDATFSTLENIPSTTWSASDLRSYHHHHHQQHEPLSQRSPVEAPSPVLDPNKYSQSVSALYSTVDDDDSMFQSDSQTSHHLAKPTTSSSSLHHTTMSPETRISQPFSYAKNPASLSSVSASPGLIHSSRHTPKEKFHVIDRLAATSKPLHLYHHHHSRQKHQRMPSSPLNDNRIDRQQDRIPIEVIQKLLDIYLAFVHPMWPIIYLPSIASLHSLQIQKPIVFEAILAVASTTFDSRVDTSVASHLSESDRCSDSSPGIGFESDWSSTELCNYFLHRVKKRIFESNFEKDISIIQAAILVSVIEMGSGNSSGAWHFGGIACRMALDMNLHRKSRKAFVRPAQSDPSHLGSVELQEQRRVLWACFILDKILCTVLEKPVQMRRAEIETDFPSVHERDEYDLWLNDHTAQFVHKGWRQTLQGAKVHAISSFQAWAQIMMILENILEQVYSPKAKKERHRTRGESDWPVLLQLEQELSTWRSSLPFHLQWQDRTAVLNLAFLIESQGSERPGTFPHRGVSPQVLTMRGWYCVCVILLHRPRAPQLFKSAKQTRPKSECQENTSSGDSAEESADPIQPLASANRSGSSISEGRPLQWVSTSPLHPPGTMHSPPKCYPPSHPQQPDLLNQLQSNSGLEICSAAAKEVCDILRVYYTTFRIRKISSSWVYLVFQSATIHSALAASKRATAFQQRILAKKSQNRTSSTESCASNDSFSDSNPCLNPNSGHILNQTNAAHSHPGEHQGFEVEKDEDIPRTRAEIVNNFGSELEELSDNVKDSTLYLAECIHLLERISATWHSASHHVATLRRLCIASAQSTRAPHPSHGHAVEMHAPSVPMSASRKGPTGKSRTTTLLARQPVELKDESNASNDAPFSMTGSLPVDRCASAVSASAPYAFELDLLASQASRLAAVPPSTSLLSMAPTTVLQENYPVLPHNGAALTSVDNQQHSFISSSTPSTSMVQQEPINANDSAFWDSMPISSEGFVEWDGFLKTFNAGVNSIF